MQEHDTPNSQPVMIRPPEWSRRTGMSRTETYRLMNAGQIRAAKVGKMWFIYQTELTEFFEREGGAR